MATSPFILKQPYKQFKLVIAVRDPLLFGHLQSKLDEIKLTSLKNQRTKFDSSYSSYESKIPYESKELPNYKKKIHTTWDE